MLKLKGQIDEVLATLTPREQMIIRRRFGLDDGQFPTLKEVGQEFGVGKERIRQIQAKALRKLRHPSRSNKLRGFLEEKFWEESSPIGKLLGAIFPNTCSCGHTSIEHHSGVGRCYVRIRFREWCECRGFKKENPEGG